MTWVTDYKSDDMKVELESLDGIPWWQAPLPHWIHRCRAQTRGYMNWFDHVERCACGAIRLNRRRWQEKNSGRRRR